MTRQDDGANGWPPADDRNVVASGVDIDDGVATQLDWFDIDALVVDEVSDDVEFDIFDATPDPIVLPPITCSLVLTVSSELLAFGTANWRVLPSSRRRCNPDIFLYFWEMILILWTCFWQIDTSEKWKSIVYVNVLMECMYCVGVSVIGWCKMKFVLVALTIYVFEAWKWFEFFYDNVCLKPTKLQAWRSIRGYTVVFESSTLIVIGSLSVSQFEQIKQQISELNVRFWKQKAIQPISAALASPSHLIEWINFHKLQVASTKHNSDQEQGYSSRYPSFVAYLIHCFNAGEWK